MANTFRPFLATKERFRNQYFFFTNRKNSMTLVYMEQLWMSGSNLLQGMAAGRAVPGNVITTLGSNV